MAIMLNIDADRLPKNWNLPDTRNLDFTSNTTSFIDEIDEAARRVAIAREALNETFTELVIRPEFVAQVKCTDVGRPDWCSYTIASIDMDKLLSLDDSIVEEFKMSLKDKNYTHATIDFMHTPIGENAVFLLHRSIDIRDVDKLLADGVEERLRGVEDDAARIASPVDISKHEDHSREIFEKAEIYYSEINKRGQNIVKVSANNAGFSVLTELFGVHQLIHVPTETIDVDESGNMDSKIRARLIARAADDARKLAKGTAAEAQTIDWQVVNVDIITEKSTPILFGTV